MASAMHQGSEEAERILESFGNDLWIRRRLTLDEVITLLKQKSSDHNNQVTNSRAQAFVDYIRFVEFLKEQCSGQHFTSDKQWGHILNLMGVSRKVNHKSAKFSDIIKSKNHIESNLQDIVNFNESVRQATLASEQLGELEKNLESCQITIGCPDSTTTVHQIHTTDISEISKARRNLENICGSLAYNLRMHLYSRPIDPIFERDRDVWRDKFSRLESTFKLLSKFLNDYHDFKKSFIELHPLLQNLEAGQPNPTNISKVDRMNDNLQNMLNFCKFEFNRVIIFDRKFTDYLNTQAKKKSTLPDNSSHKQQVRTLNLSNLLDSRNQYKDELLADGLQKNRKCLDSCQGTLTHIKRSLRLEFGRFYFVNDIELLTVITLDTRLVEECDESKRRLIRKIFNNSIEEIILTDAKRGPRHITGIKNSIGETINFEETEWIPLKKRVNIYSLEVVRILNEVLRKLRRTLSRSLQKSIESWMAQRAGDLRSPTNDVDWSLPIQLFDLSEHFKFTHRVESELSTELPRLESLVEFYQARLDSLHSMTSMATSDTKDRIIGLKLSAAISITVHLITLLIDLRQTSIRSVNDWNWQKLPRFYQKRTTSDNQPDWNLDVRMANAKFAYRFDLLCIETRTELDRRSQERKASLKRLISTAVSDRCFLVASQAISKLKSGASPFGPAGSGKTETIKALGHLLGCQVIVHNCDETNDSESLERLIWGLAHTGLWGCFDEFNRLGSGTLSSVSAVLELVQASLRSGLMNIELDGGEIKSIDPDSAFFITLNPGDGAKYRGRRRLPANLRGLFLPVAMCHVQLEAIVRQMLLIESCSSFEITEARKTSNQLNATSSTDIARRLSYWIQRAKSEFTNSGFSRCEFDLRLVLAILRRLFKLMSAGHRNVPGESSRLVDLVIESIQVEVQPRLGQSQLDMLEKTLADSFETTVSINRKQDKITQLEEQLEGRSGVILLGESGTGKSNTWQSLLANLNKDRQIICHSTLNPKAYNKEDLFGHFDSSTGKWIDGIFTSMVRTSASKLQTLPSIQQAWIILDGLIDPDWVECLNSVLDDNQVLTLSSGERIDFVINREKCIKLIFETDTIEYASPATMSRLGLVLHESPTPSPSDLTNLKSLDLTIVHGGSDSYSRLAQAKALARPSGSGILYSCNELSDSDCLIELMQLASDSHNTYIIQNLDLIRNEDKWGSNTFVELLRYVITYGRYYDKESNEIVLSGDTKFIITIDSDRHVSDNRLLTIARTTSVSCGGHKPEASNYETTQLFAREQIFANLASPVITVIECDDSLTVKQDLSRVIGTDPSENIDIYRFTNGPSQNQSLEKLYKLLLPKTMMGIKIDRKSVFLIDSLELRLMNRSNKRMLYQTINMLFIKNLLGPDSKFLVLVRNLDDLDARFWSSLGNICSIKSSSTLRESLLGLLERKLGNVDELQHVDWLSKEVARIAEDREYVTQQHFISILVEMIARLKEGAGQHLKMLQSGLDKLNGFKSHIQAIKAQKEREDEVLGKKRLDIEKLMQQIDTELRKSAIKKDELAQLKSKLAIKSADLDSKTKNIQSELDHVLPIVETSKQEVSKCLKPEALNEIRTLRSPPKTIKDILDVLFVFLDVQDTSWSSMKAYLTRVSLKDELTNYDLKARLDSDRLARIKREIELKQDSFRMQQAKRASTAIVPILNWINAGLQYGQVSVRLKPLGEARDQLGREAQELINTMADLERDSKRLEDRIDSDKKLLKNCEAEYEESEKAAEAMASELMSAQKVIENSQKQVVLWRERLTKLETLTTDDKNIYRVCLVCSTFAIWCEKLDAVKELLNNFGFNFDSVNLREIFHALVENNVNILLESLSEKPIETGTTKSDEFNLTSQIIRLKLCLLFKSYPRLPFVHIDKSTSDEKITGLLSTSNILCRQDELTIIRPACSQAGSWRQSLDMSLKLRKLVVVHLDRPNLDAIDAVLQNYPNSNIILCGKLTLDKSGSDPLDQLLIRVPANQSSDGNQAEVANRICNLLLKSCNPEIGNKISELQSSLQVKQHEERLLEASFLKKLHHSSAGRESQLQTEHQQGMSLQGDLIRTLNELQKASESLQANMCDVKGRLRDLLLSETRYMATSTNLAAFHQKILLPFQDRDDFYHLSIENLVDMVLESSPSRNTDSTHFALHIEQLQQILTHFMCPMRPEHRISFRDAVRKAGDELTSMVEASHPSDLSQLVEESYKTSADLCHNLSDLLFGENNVKGSAGASGCRRDCNFELAVIMHDEKKPSPQIVVDELLRRRATALNSKDNEFSYQKVYATSQRQIIATNDTCSSANHQQPLETELRRIIMSQSNVGNNKSSQSQARSQTKCICIANAHLAARWVNTRFLGMLEETCRHVSIRYVFILIVESSEAYCSADTNNGSGDKLDFNLLEAASLKFWYDELALNALDRYNLYLGALRDTHALARTPINSRKDALTSKALLVTASKRPETVISTGAELSNATCESARGQHETSELVEDLVMFHVVCQELIRLKRALTSDPVGLTLWRKADYNFDYEQLLLGLEIWRQINDDEADNKPAKRNLFCHLLDSIVYGSRLETVEDEKLLAVLLKRFMQMSAVPGAVTRGECSIALERLAQIDLSRESLDEISSARYADELAGLIETRK